MDEKQAVSIAKRYVLEEYKRELKVQSVRLERGIWVIVFDPPNPVAAMFSSLGAIVRVDPKTGEASSMSQI